MKNKERFLTLTLLKLNGALIMLTAIMVFRFFPMIQLALANAFVFLLVAEDYKEKNITLGKMLAYLIIIQLFALSIFRLAT